jgi:hypothetical protein
LLGSTIVGLEHHTPQNIREEIDFAVSHATDFHQFMLYTPVPGTPLFHEMREEGRLLDVDLADIHGQFKFNFQHAAISRDESKRFLDWAFRRDFQVNGPSLFRLIETSYLGWMRYKNHPDRRVRARFEWQAAQFRHSYTGALWAMERRLKKTNEDIAARIHDLRAQVEAEFGAISRWAARVIGPVMLWSANREEKRLAKGKTYEPPTFLERRNWVEG